MTTREAKKLTKAQLVGRLVAAEQDVAALEKANEVLRRENGRFRDGLRDAHSSDDRHRERAVRAEAEANAYRAAHATLAVAIHRPGELVRKPWVHGRRVEAVANFSDEVATARDRIRENLGLGGEA